MQVNEALHELSVAGMPVAQSETATNSKSAVEAAERLGYPVVIKACGLDHKSDTGGVVVGLESGDAVQIAVRQMIDGLGAAADLLLVQKQLEGTEILLGARREPGVGAVIMVGAGGVLAELLGDTATALLPLEDRDARDLLESLRTYPVLNGYRGRRVCDTDALVKLIEDVAEYVGGHPEIAELDLNPVMVGAKGQGVAIVDARIVQTAEAIEETAQPSRVELSRLFDPQHVVVVGVSDDASKTGSRIFQSLLKHGYEGRIDPVHPDGGEIAGHKRYKGFDEIDQAPDLVSVAVPAQAVEHVVDEAIAIGAGSVVLHSSGFAETGDAGAALQTRIASKLKSAGIPFAGPNCMGIVSPPNSLAVSLSGGLNRALVPGRIALVSSSGALGSCLATRLMADGNGLSRWIHLGNEAGLDAAAYMDWLAEDDETSVVGLLLESLSEGERFIRAGRALLGSDKPVFAYSMARTAQGREAVATHTGALLGSDGLRHAVLERAGVVEVPNLRTLEDCLVLSSRSGRPAGGRMAAVTASGGACTIIADEAASSDLELPDLSQDMAEKIGMWMPGFATVRNPVDLTAQLLSDPSTFSAVLDVLVDEKAFDLVLVSLTTNADPGAEAIAHAVVERAHLGIPLYVSRYGAPALAPRALEVYAKAGIPVLDAPDRAVQAVAALVRSARMKEDLIEH